MDFYLEKSFIDHWKTVTPPFGFNGLGELVYLRTYSRLKADGENEKWWETIQRVIEGTYSIQKRHIESLHLGWDERQAQKSAQEMYTRMFQMKFLPPGRGLWSMGTDIVNKKGLGASLNNCGFVSTKNIGKCFSKPFLFTMDMSMLGVGIGFDTKGAGEVTIQQPDLETDIYVIEDSREGWVNSLGVLLESYNSGINIIFDYSKIRKIGEKLKTFGGVSSGPQPLIDLHESIKKVLDKNLFKPITVTTIVDIMNLIGKCVVSGNLRRCLPKGTLIHTQEGLIPIERVEPGTMVYTSYGLEEVAELVEQGEQEVITIVTELGEFECTEKHKIAVVSGINEYTWKMAYELQETDLLVCPSNVVEGVKTKLPEWKYERKSIHSTTCKDIIIPELDEGIAWLFGYLHGNGCVMPCFERNGFNAYVSFACDPNRPTIYEKVIEQVKRFGINPNAKLRTNGAFMVHCQSKQLSWYFSQFKKSRTSINIPSFILEGLPEIRASYAAGLFDADGSVLTRPINLCTSIYPDFLKQLQCIYASIGIPSRFKLARQAQGEWKDLYDLNLVGEIPIKDFIKNVTKFSLKYINNRKTDKSLNDYGYPTEMIINEGVKYNGKWCKNSKQMNVSTLSDCGYDINFYPVKFKEIKRTGKICETYDISVPVANEFIASQGLLVHNTALISFGENSSTEFMDLKDYSKNPQRMDYGWTSNNSIFAELGMDYTEIAKRISINGEPGLAWLDNMQNYSRMCDPPDQKDYRVMGGNPCLEQSLEDSELCCVTFDTRIHTKNGSPKIYDVVGKEVEVWNGEKWSLVVPFLASRDRDIYRVTLSDGSYLDCTDNHKWSIKTNSKKQPYIDIETKDLNINDRLELFSLNAEIEGINDANAFELGLFAGDGYIDQKTPMISFCGDKLKLRDLTNLNGIWWKEQHPKEYKDPICRFSLKNVLDLEICKHLNDKKKGFPDYIFTLDKISICKFVAGYIETDGTLRMNKDSHHYVIFGSELKLRDFQILLRRININHATIRLVSPKGFETNKGIRKQDLYSLCIPSYECEEISRYIFIKKATIFSTGMCKNRAHDISLPISNKSVQKIKKIEKLQIKQDTYCFTEPEKNKGVFGNVLTHQCLVESFLNRAESCEDFLRTLKFSYLYAKSVTLINTHCAETNRVQLRNRRIGCSVTGVAQFLAKQNLHSLNHWLKSGYETVKHWDTVYSEWFCIPKSIKMTSVKPSGTVSLLAGATPGMHFPESRFYIRRMRLASNSPLVDPLEKAGYKIEPCVGSESTTVVIEIPIDVGEGIRTVSEVSMWEQLSLAANMQRWWADNQVSCTITFNPQTEGGHIASALDYFQYQLKGVSFLPKCDYGAYPQMPYEEITEQEYHASCKKLKRLEINKIAEDSVGEKFCDGEACYKV